MCVEGTRQRDCNVCPCQSVCQSVCLSVSLSLSVCLSICLSVRPLLLFSHATYIETQSLIAHTLKLLTPGYDILYSLCVEEHSESQMCSHLSLHRSKMAVSTLKNVTAHNCSGEISPIANHLLTLDTLIELRHTFTYILI